MFNKEKSISNELEQLIKTTAEIKIDGIIFNDFAINQICYENKIDIKLIYLVRIHFSFHFRFLY